MQLAARRGARAPRLGHVEDVEVPLRRRRRASRRCASSGSAAGLAASRSTPKPAALGPLGRAAPPRRARARAAGRRGRSRAPARPRRRPRAAARARGRRNGSRAPRPRRCIEPPSGTMPAKSPARRPSRSPSQACAETIGSAGAHRATASISKRRSRAGSGREGSRAPVRLRSAPCAAKSPPRKRTWALRRGAALGRGGLLGRSPAWSPRRGWPRARPVVVDPGGRLGQGVLQISRPSALACTSGEHALAIGVLVTLGITELRKRSGPAAPRSRAPSRRPRRRPRRLLDGRPRHDLVGEQHRREHQASLAAG